MRTFYGSNGLQDSAYFKGQRPGDRLRYQQKVHLSVSAVLDRIKKMEESGLIKGYTVVVDSKAMGNDVTALMEISLEHPRYHDSILPR